MNHNELYITTYNSKNSFIDKFREAVNIYETCKGNSKKIRALNESLKNICLDQSSFYQNDHVRISRTNFLYNSSTPLSYKVLRYAYAEDKIYFRDYYKGKKETELARAIELITEAMNV